MKKTFYVTTPLYYVNAKPHLGSLYSTLIADVVMRWHRLKGEKTFFLTGTDEHGQKVAQAAHDAGKSPKDFVDGLVPSFKDAWKHYNIDYSKFIRTTDSEHIKGAQQFVTNLLEKGDIYKDTYEGWYCVSCETFVTGKDITDQTDVHCASCGRPTTHIAEQTYFFRLSAYQDALLKWFKENPTFITPKERFNEVITFVENGLKDLSISRTTVPWGIPFPNDTKHTIYVWIEALCNYITAIGYGDAKRHAEFMQIWPADVQVIGKDIVRFHAIYWPALLMAAGLSLPKKLLVHGWITVDKQKMSKSLGNVIDPIVLSNDYGVDPVRYYLLKHMPITQDGNFSFADLEQSIVAELANNIGNLLNRTTTLAQKNDAMVLDVPKNWSQEAEKVRVACEHMMQSYDNHMKDYYFHLALNEILHFMHTVNAYFHANEPWKLAKKDAGAFKEIVSVVAHSLRAVAYYIMPIMPEKMMELLRSLGIVYSQDTDTYETLNLSIWNQAFSLHVVSPLFIKPEIKATETPISSTDATEAIDTSILFDDWIKVELRVGTIESVEPVPNSNKLLCLQVDFGQHGKRQILAGVQQTYTSSDLINTQATFVFNLKPRKMLGMDSQGMLLVAKDEQGIPRIVRPIHAVPSGTQLQ